MKFTANQESSESEKSINTKASDAPITENTPSNDKDAVEFKILFTPKQTTSANL